METQTQMDMANQEIQEQATKEPVDDVTEKQFLRDLHLFMKKRDTPIERIPNLGFKQIDLFLMYQTVKDLGGYHQVTAQQLWKQVYNRLGGNPRSTSAATCTRRHYEKLLLPYECHVKGISMNILPQHQPKHLQFAFNKYEDDGQRPAKRKLLSIPVRQDPLNLQADPRGHVYPLSLHYPPYYHPSHTVLTPHVPVSSVMTPHRPPAPQPQFSFHPYHLNSAERVKEPLEQLRYLAEQYKTTSGLTEPLNLSTKTDRTKQETSSSSPASSFAPPSSSKNPKFLNKPSPLYTPHSPRVVKSDGCDTQDGDPGLGDPEYSHPVKATQAYIVDITGSPASSSPMHDSCQTPKTDEGTNKPGSPQSNFTVWSKDDREGSPEVLGPNLSRILPRLPRENGGKMEIEIPISVLHNWLRLFAPSAMTHEAKQVLTLPALDQHSGQRNSSDMVLPTNLTFHINSQQSLAAEDLRLRQGSLPSPTPLTQLTDSYRGTSQHPLSSFKPAPFGSILKNAASRDVYPCNLQDINKSYSSKHTHGWDAYDKETQPPPLQGKADSSPVRGQDFAAYVEDAVQKGKEKSERGPSAVLMGNSDCMLQLTPEEVMKLKKIISNSS